MRKGWIALAICTGLAAGFAWGTSTPTEAAMVISGGKANMSLVEQAAKKSKKQCTTYLFWECCKAPGKPETCDLKKM
jgi:uncharacterized membrane-anchored protein